MSAPIARPIPPLVAPLIAVAAAALAGCADLGYYGQAIDGHLDLMAARRPLDEAIADPVTPEDERARLAEAREIRRFAVESLALPEGGSYRSYVSLDRPYVVWNVVAAPELSVEPRTWCFPVAGCVAYRGYFDEGAARAFAAKLEGKGLDVHVGGARAYSTLGWFDDPLLSTMLSGRAYDVAGVVFHELAHERVYVADDSEFNEAYAVAVERAGVRRWLLATGRHAELEDYERGLERRARFTAAVLQTRARLRAIYASGAPPDEMRARKAQAIEVLRGRLRALAVEWGDPRRLAAWTEGPINNARLALLATYHERVPAFESILAKLDGDMSAFHAEVARIGALAKDERARALAAARPEAREQAG